MVVYWVLVDRGLAARTHQRQPRTQKVPDYQQKAILRQIRWCCVLILPAWTLRPVRPVRPVLRRDIGLRLVRLDTLLSTGFCPDTWN